MINRLHAHLWIWILSSCVQLISHSFAALSREISSWTLEDQIHIHVRACTCNILYFCNMKWLEVFLSPLPPGGWDTYPSQGYPSLNSPVHIYTPGWSEALWECSVFPKNTILWPQPGRKPGPLRVKHTEHETTMPSDAWHNVTEMYAQEKHWHKMNDTPLFCTTLWTDPQFKVHLTPKYIFLLNKSLHLFEMHCAFLN